MAHERPGLCRQGTSCQCRQQRFLTSTESEGYHHNCFLCAQSFHAASANTITCAGMRRQAMQACQLTRTHQTHMPTEVEGTDIEQRVDGSRECRAAEESNKLCRRDKAGQGQHEARAACCGVKQAGRRACGLRMRGRRECRGWACMSGWLAACQGMDSKSGSSCTQHARQASSALLPTEQGLPLRSAKLGHQASHQQPAHMSMPISRCGAGGQRSG